MNGLNSFELTGIGRLAEDPKVGAKGEVTFALIGDDYAGKDRGPIATTVQLVAFAALGEAIAKHARKGDQLIVNAQMQASNYERDGKTVYGYSYIVRGFRFGAPGKAKREEFEHPRTG
jgi:single-strand DNA-binding protein